MGIYWVFPLRAWAGEKRVHVEPARWDYARPTLEGATFALSEKDGTRVAVAEADGATAGTLQVAFSLRGNAVANGGPVLGVGGQPEPGEARLRVGWEIAGPSWPWSYALVAETNAKDRFLVSAVIEGSLPNVLGLFPGVGVGVGPVVGGGPRGAYGGVRVQPMLAWPFLSFVLPIDVVAPSFTSGSGTLVSVGVLGQLSL